MPSKFLEDTATPVWSFRGVDGNKINLIERKNFNTNATINGVIEFTLQNNSFPKIHTNLLLLILTLFLWIVTESITLTLVPAIALVFQCRNIITSVNIDTILVVESVGVQVVSKRRFKGLNTSQFLPWNTIEDVFINEVITGRRKNKISPFVSRVKARKKMPGVYLRSSGWFNHIKQETEQVLTIPGSYWLHHKKNIYKFTFKRHIDIKNVREFPYAGELMKVIRRIIKCRPCQGQQFGTRHLLITCNHIYWRRQDKMFAMLMFHNKPDAVAFPQAYILTVNIVVHTEEMPVSYAECIDLISNEKDISDKQNTIYLEKNDDTVDSRKHTSCSDLKEYEISRVHKVDDQISKNNSLEKMLINSSQRHSVTSPAINSNNFSSIDEVQCRDSNLNADLVKIKNNPRNECISVIQDMVAKDTCIDTNSSIILEKSNELFQEVVSEGDEAHQNYSQDKDKLVKRIGTKLNEEKCRSVGINSDLVQRDTEDLGIASCTKHYCDSLLPRYHKEDSSCNYLQQNFNEIQSVETIPEQTKSESIDYLEELPLSERFLLWQTATIRENTTFSNTNTCFKTVNSNKIDTTDSLVLPYQYLIEKEIKNSEKKSLSNTTDAEFSTTDYKMLNELKTGKMCTEAQMSSQNTFASSSWQENDFHSDSSKSNDRELNCTCHNEIIKNHKCDSDGATGRNDKLEKNTKNFHSKCTVKYSLNKFKRNRVHPYAKVSRRECNVVDEQNGNDCELKGKPENVIPRSSDITDLVMEGLMFTIKEDQDSVMVVEQKTKLEMDEVLENSEKAETKEGEKCLLNSSLLKLENLITNIKVSKDEEKILCTTKDTLKKDDIFKLDAKFRPTDIKSINDEVVIKNKHKLSSTTLVQYTKNLLGDACIENVENNLKQLNTLYSDFESNSSKSNIKSINTSPCKIYADSLKCNTTLLDITKDSFPCNKINFNNRTNVLKYDTKLNYETSDTDEISPVVGTSLERQESGTSVIPSFNLETITTAQISPFNLQSETTYFNDEEEDIVPEVLQQNIFRPLTMSEKQTNVFSNFEKKITRPSKDLLMDDTDNIEQSECNAESLKGKTYVLRSTNTKYKRFLSPSKIVSTLNSKDNIGEEHFSDQSSALLSVKKNRGTDVKHVPKIPRVISDMILTNDQIPSDLQKALRSNKLVKFESNSKQKKETGLNNSNNSASSSLNNLSSIVTQAFETSERLNFDTSESNNSLDVKAKVSNKRTEQEVFSTKDTHDTDTSLSMNEITEKTLPVQDIMSITNVQLNTFENKQDITEDFYQNLTLQIKNKFSYNRRNLRLRKRSSLEAQSKKSINDKLYVRMWKLIQDITLGAKVVVTRISTPNITSVKGESSFTVTGNNENSTNN